MSKSLPFMLAAGATAGLLLSGAYLWQFQSSAPAPETSGLFCAAMADPQAYKDKKVETYATLIPGKDGWIFRTKNDFRTNWSMSDDALNRLLALQKAMRTHNAELVIVMPPVRGMVHTREMQEADKKKYGMSVSQDVWDDYEHFISDAQAEGLNIVGINRNEVNDQFFYKRNHHWSAAGAKVAAEKAAKVIKALPAYAQIPKVEYVTNVLPEEKYKSSYQGAFQKICGTKVEPETAQNYQTVQANQANSEGALFDSATEPQIVLLGTSNSVNDSAKANFDGFLKQAASADVLNLAVAGAGIDTSLISYLNSAHYKSKEPKIIVWEIPGYYEFDTINENVLTQAVPAAYGSCSQDAIVAADFKRVADNEALYASQDGGSNGEYQVDEAARHKNLKTNNDLYLHLSFTQPIKKEFSTKFHYKIGENGQTKLVKFKRSNRYPADGDFYAMFPRMDKAAELNKIRLILPKDMKSADVSMQVCAMPPAKPANESM